MAATPAARPQRRRQPPAGGPRRAGAPVVLRCRARGRTTRWLRHRILAAQTTAALAGGAAGRHWRRKTRRAVARLSGRFVAAQHVLRPASSSALLRCCAMNGRPRRGFRRAAFAPQNPPRRGSAFGPLRCRATMSCPLPSLPGRFVAAQPVPAPWRVSGPPPCRATTCCSAASRPWHSVAAPDGAGRCQTLPDAAGRCRTLPDAAGRLPDAVGRKTAGARRTAPLSLYVARSAWTATARPCTRVPPGTCLALVTVWYGMSLKEQYP
jgi:hypothetical protein